jgi:hypothetical protein
VFVTHFVVKEEEILITAFKNILKAQCYILYQLLLSHICNSGSIAYLDPQHPVLPISSFALILALSFIVSFPATLVHKGLTVFR